MATAMLPTRSLREVFGDNFGALTSSIVRGVCGSPSLGKYLRTVIRPLREVLRSYSSLSEELEESVLVSSVGETATGCEGIASEVWHEGSVGR